MRRYLVPLVVAALSLTALPAAAAPAPTASDTSSTSAEPSASRKIIKARYGTFRAKTFRGKGTKILRLPKRATRGIVTIKAPGEGTIKAQLLAKDKKKTLGRPLAGKTTTPYRGTTVFGLDTNQYDPTFLKVESTSAKRWTVKVQPLHKAKALKKKQKGSGDAVFRMTLPSSKTWKIKYRSDIKDNLIVKSYGLTHNQVLWNEIVTRYTGKQRVWAFSGFVEVRSSGNWTITR